MSIILVFYDHWKGAYKEYNEITTKKGNLT